jgi:hypothetical protein
LKKTTVRPLWKSICNIYAPIFFFAIYSRRTIIMSHHGRFMHCLQ